MSLTFEDNNTTITMTIGETKKITLKGNPTTGYSWIALESIKVENVIQYDQNPDTEGMAGAGGMFNIDITAKEAGEGKLVLVYRRPWAPSDKDNTFTLNIQIQ